MKFTTDDLRLQNALALLCSHAPLYSDVSEVSVTRLPGDGNGISWMRQGGDLTLRADSVSDCLFLLGRALTLPEKTEESLMPRFSRLAAMIDLSRNSVYTMKTMKRFLCQLALMGFNTAYILCKDGQNKGQKWYGPNRSRRY